MAFLFANPNTVPVTEESFKSISMLPNEIGREANSSASMLSLSRPCIKAQEQVFFAL
jgi:hypothetical protein